jgi:hypothetical protein
LRGQICKTSKDRGADHDAAAVATSAKHQKIVVPTTMPRGQRRATLALIDAQGV